MNSYWNRLLNRAIWTKLNRIRTGHGRCNNTLHLWGSMDDPGCDCGFAIQDIRHIVLECGLRRFDGDLMQLHVCDDAAIQWLNNLDLAL